MNDSSRLFVVGGAESWPEAIRSRFDQAVETGMPTEPRAGDVVFLDAATPAGVESLPHGNAFSACCELKRDPRVHVFLAVRSADPFGAEIARFCMADGVVTIDADGRLCDVDRVAELLGSRRGHVRIDSLLARLEGELSGDAERVTSGLQRILAESEEGGFVARLTDAETGLFDGPFAGFKLDEEFKRASRFHQPLSLVLLDSGVTTWPADDVERRTVLAEVAAIFLNEFRDIDVLARFTDSVFLFLLPGTGPEGAEIAARRIVRSLEEREFSAPIELRPAAGIATVPHPAVRDRKGFLARAETALDRARADAESGGVHVARE